MACTQNIDCYCHEKYTSDKISTPKYFLDNVKYIKEPLGSEHSQNLFRQLLCQGVIGRLLDGTES